MIKKVIVVIAPLIAFLFMGATFAEEEQKEEFSREGSRETYDILADEIAEKAASLKGMLEEMDFEFRNSMAAISEIETSSRNIGMLERESIEHKLKGEPAEMGRIDAEARTEKGRVKELKSKLPQSSDDFYARLDLANDKASRIRLLVEDMRAYCRRSLSTRAKGSKPENSADWKAVQFKGF